MSPHFFTVRYLYLGTKETLPFYNICHSRDFLKVSENNYGIFYNINLGSLYVNLKSFY